MFSCTSRLNSSVFIHLREFLDVYVRNGMLEFERSLSRSFRFGSCTGLLFRVLFWFVFTPH